MLWLSAMFAAGIAASACVPVSAVTLASACALLAAGSLVLARTRTATALVSAAFIASGAFVYGVHLASVTPDRIRSLYDSGRIVSGDPVELSGTITGEMETASDGFFFRVRVDSIQYRGEPQTASGTVRFFAPVTSSAMDEDYRRLGLHSGDRIGLACELAREDRFRNPGVLSGKTVLDWQDIDATGVIKSPLLIEKLDSSGFGPVAAVFRFREGVIARYREMFTPQVSGVMVASLLGNKQFLDKGTADVFREGGTFHILVISGLHITFIGGLAALFVGLFTRRKWVQFAAACGFLWLYTLAVGAEVPVVRASLMFTVLWFSYVVHRRSSLANALGTCGLVLLAWRPADLFTPSFQLTFVSVSAIVLAGFPLIRKLHSIGEWTPSSSEPFPPNSAKWLKRFCETLYWNPKRWEIESARQVWSASLFKSPCFTVNRTLQKSLAYLFEGVAVSFIVQIAMLPVVVHYFHRVTPVSVLTNLWSGVLIGLESFASLLAVMFSYLSWPLALPFVRLTELLQWLMVSVPGPFVDIGWSSFRVPVYAGSERWIYGLYFVLAAVLGFGIFLWDPYVRRTRRMLRTAILLPAAGLSVLACVIVLHPFSEPQPDGKLHLEFLDVGQGDSAFITFPDGETMLIDGGGRTSYRNEEDGESFEPDVPSIGERVVSEFIWEKGYSHIDYIIGTHADSDHIQGLTDVARNFSIGKALFGRPPANDPDQVRLEEALKRRAVPVEKLLQGDRMEIGGVTIEVFNPPPDAPEWTKENDRSVVVRLTFGERSFLFTGDIEQAVEARIAELDLKADVVKVPHHGSRTSSTEAFVSAVHPRHAVIPVGTTSPFGHPHREVVERWKAAGAEVLTTGSLGTVSFVTNGTDLSFSSFVRDGSPLKTAWSNWR